MGVMTMNGMAHARPAPLCRHLPAGPGSTRCAPRTPAGFVPVGNDPARVGAPGIVRAAAPTGSGRAEEQVAERTTPQVGQPAPPQVFGPVVDQMTALAPCREIPVAVAAGVVPAVAGRQDRLGQPRPGQGGQPGRSPQRQAATVAPDLGLGVVPCPRVEADDDLPVRPSAGLAAPAGPPEADRGRELRPVDRVEVALFGTDRHGPATLAWPSRERSPLGGRRGRDRPRARGGQEPRDGGGCRREPPAPDASRARTPIERATSTGECQSHGDETQKIPSRSPGRGALPVGHRCALVGRVPSGAVQAGADRHLARSVRRPCRRGVPPLAEDYGTRDRDA